jgi:hypothetical protein
LIMGLFCVVYGSNRGGISTSFRLGNAR